MLFRTVFGGLFRESSLNSNLGNKLTVIDGYHNVLTIRNLNLTYTNGAATYDASNKIGATNEVIGIATYPYNRQIPSSITSNNGVLKIVNDSQSLNGAYYTNIIIFVF